MKKKSLFIQKTLTGILFICLCSMDIFGTMLIPPRGDANRDNKVDILDALITCQYSIGLFEEDFIDTQAADVNGNDVVEIIDALIIAQYVVGLFDQIDNPFDTEKWYVDPEWSAHAAAGGGDAITGCNTAIWLDRIGAITDGVGLRGHMDQALVQGAETIVFVINDVPFKNCWSEHYNIENSPDDVDRYKHEFIDPIAAILSGPLYKELKIVCIIEPLTLVNLITGIDIHGCREASAADGMIESIQYALNSLSAIPNVYNYMDIARSSWLGWDTNIDPAVQLISSCVNGTLKGVHSIAGFVSNVSNYVPEKELYLPDPYLTVGGLTIRSSDYYEWNNYFGELKYTKEMRRRFIAEGFPESVGILIDTSRNGWGGPDRPVAVSTSTDLNTYVNTSRLDRRLHRGNWCNQVNAGLGRRPTADTGEDFIDAFLWIWPPGYSDGISDPDFLPNPENSSLIFSRMCDPDERCIYNRDVGTGAAAGAPHRGRWFQTGFETLLANAWPPLN